MSGNQDQYRRGLSGVGHLFRPGGLGPDLNPQPTENQFNRAQQTALHQRAQYQAQNRPTLGLQVNVGSPASSAYSSPAYSSSYASQPTTAQPAFQSPAFQSPALQSPALQSPDSAYLPSPEPMNRRRPGGLNLAATQFVAPYGNAAAMQQELMEEQMRNPFAGPAPQVISDLNLGADPVYDARNAGRWARGGPPQGGTRKRNRKNVSKRKRKYQSRRKNLSKRK